MKRTAISLLVFAATCIAVAEDKLPDHAIRVVGNDAYVFPAVETRFIDSSRVIAVGRYEAAIVDIKTGAVTRRVTDAREESNPKRIVGQSVIGGTRYLATPVYSGDETQFLIRDLSATEASTIRRVTCDYRVREYCLSDDGKCLAVYHPHTKSVDLYATESAERLDRQAVPLPGRPVTQLHFVNQGSAILLQQKSSVGQGFRVYIYARTADGKFGNEVSSIDRPGSLYRIAPTPVEDWVIISSLSREVTVFDFLSSETVVEVKLGVSSMFADVSSDKQKLVTSGASTWFEVWDIRDPQQPVVAQSIDAGARPSSVAFNADGSKIVASVAGRVRFWDSVSGEELQSTVNQAIGPIAAISISPDQTRVATADRQGRSQLWNLETGQPIRLVDKKRGKKRFDPWVSPQFLQFSSDGTKVLGGSSDAHNVVNLWDASTGNIIRSFSGHRWPIMGVTWSPDGEMIASTSRDKTMRVINRHGTLLHSFDDATMSPVFFPGGEKIIASSDYGSCSKLNVFDLNTGKQSMQLYKSGSPTRVGGTAVSKNGKQIAATFQGGQVQAWNAVNGELIFDVELGARRAQLLGSVAYSQDGKTLAAVVGTNLVYLLDPVTGKVQQELSGHRGPVAAVATGNDILVSAGQDHRIIVWKIPD